MKLTERDIRECMDYEDRWCALPRTAGEERQVVALLESMEDRRIIVPDRPVPHDVQVLIEQVESSAPADTPPTGTRTENGTRSVTPPNGDSHERMVAAFRGSPGPTPRVLTEDRRARDVTSLSETERLEPYLRLAGAEPVLPEGIHEKMARAFGVGR